MRTLILLLLLSSIAYADNFDYSIYKPSSSCMNSHSGGADATLTIVDGNTVNVNFPSCSPCAQCDGDILASSLPIDCPPSLGNKYFQASKQGNSIQLISKSQNTRTCTVSFVKNSASVTLADGKKSLGTASSLGFTLTPFTVSDSSQTVIVYAGSFPSTTSSSLSSTVYACLDADQNSICDTDEQQGPPPPPPGEGEECVPGEACWVESEAQYTWDHSSVGLCPDTSDCLVMLAPGAFSEVNPALNDPANYYQGYCKNQPNCPTSLKIPQCIDNGEFILDYYCNDGAWTSRAKMIAESLAGIGGSDYTLYCDTYSNVLNRFDYQLAGKIVSSYVGANYCRPSNSYELLPCTNNICVLQYDNGVAIGASMNMPKNDANSFIKTLTGSENDCNNVASGSDFQQCDDEENRLFYNPGINSVIYLPSGSIGSAQLFAETEAAEIFSYIQSYANNPTIPRDFSSMQNAWLFKQVYFDESPSKKVFGFFEHIQGKNYSGAKYEGFNYPQKKCDDNVKRYLGGGASELQKYSCNSTQTGFYVVAKEKFATDIWRDLTSKLRIP